MAQVKEIKAAIGFNKSAATATAKVLGAGAQGLYDRINFALEQELSTVTENSRFDGKTDEEIAAIRETERTEAIARLQAEAAAKITPKEPEPVAEPEGEPS